jgi:hypothetical protein
MWTKQILTVVGIGMWIYIGDRQQGKYTIYGRGQETRQMFTVVDMRTGQIYAVKDRQQN